MGYIYAYLVVGEPAVCCLDVRLELGESLPIPVDVDIVEIALSIEGFSKEI